jgi:hypothetical protein
VQDSRNMKQETRAKLFDLVSCFMFLVS